MELDNLRAVSQARVAEEKRMVERRRNTLVLIMRHLVDAGYVESYERLSAECNLSLQKVDVADNIDLVRIIQEFEEAYEMKYDKKPKLVKRHVAETAAEGKALNRNLSHPGSQNAPMSGALAARQRRERGASAEAGSRPAGSSALPDIRTSSPQAKDRAPLPRAPTSNHAHPHANSHSHPQGGPHEDRANPSRPGQPPLPPPMQIQGAGVQRGEPAKKVEDGAGSDDDLQGFHERPMKPLPLHLQGELRSLGSAISRDIVTENPNVKWEDIAGLDTAKRLLKEAVVMPIKYPELFTGLLAPWKGVLLYGPSGTGKTLLAKAVATQCRTTFFNVQASTIISKWRGDSEKLVRVLFELAQHHAPSTIFLDEVDALMTARGQEGEHEASRRMKTELLIQMDGLAKSNALVFVLAATNLPWELDMAMLRRLEKRILVPLPSHEARLRMFEHLLTGRVRPEVTFAHMASKTEGYSGSDVVLVAKEAAMRPLRRLMAQLDCLDDEPHSNPQQAQAAQDDVHRNVASKLEPIAMSDVDAALSVTKPSARLLEQQYKKFSDEFGQSGT
uniref:Katanin p60 ATPase-containing subunit A-like 2 n=1 Tax=Dunaliella tertiolecta TaxID=3047 RepID=A0A7S3VHK4_DUNTE|mmetsp:Transcript_27953/g.75507  ORF Transcript_27953/g.75507 Transcript_27953/m.75507 type:complete len:560 (-) Transcript_27953:311-1990(-)